MRKNGNEEYWLELNRTLLEVLIYNSKVHKTGQQARLFQTTSPPSKNGSRDAGSKADWLLLK